MTDETHAAERPHVAAQDELKAMGTIDAALEALADRETKQRVFDWAAGRHGLNAAAPARGRASGTGARPRADEAEAEPQEFADFADMYNAADPQNDRQRLLAAGWWIQTRLNEQNLHADNVNELLTPLGHRIERVRDVVPALLVGSPRLMIRVGKGKGTRGRVDFRLTAAGLNSVNQALAAGGFGNVA